VLSDIFLVDVVCFLGERLLVIICHANCILNPIL